MEALGEWKRQIHDHLTDQLSRRFTRFASVSWLGPDAAERLVEFTGLGKMIRGGLVCLSYTLFREHVTDDVLSAAAAVELFQSALLAHDDIMDKDETRRGHPSMHVQYADLARDKGSGEPVHTGEALAMCNGDIAFFLAFEILAGVDDPTADTGRRSGTESAARRLMEISARELTLVGIAQMADVLRGSIPDSDGNVDDTLRVYLYKTGRYTFSMPLALGATLAGATRESVSALELIGQQLGILFQIKDDEIGLFGDEAVVGKPVGSDIKEGKKTLYFDYLMQFADEETKTRLAGIFGSEDITSAEIDYVKSVIRKLGVDAKVRDLCNRYAEEAKTLIEGLENVRPAGRDLLFELLDYNMKRRK